jgi:hypothetical protein
MASILDFKPLESLAKLSVEVAAYPLATVSSASSCDEPLSGVR